MQKIKELLGLCVHTWEMLPEETTYIVDCRKCKGQKIGFIVMCKKCGKTHTLNHTIWFAEHHYMNAETDETKYKIPSEYIKKLERTKKILTTQLHYKYKFSN